ncbi:4131_t:CDS:2, partial [Gigaspora rosea]
MMLITRHKFQKGLAIYECLKAVTHYEASSNYNNNDKLSDYNDHDASDDYEALKKQQEVALASVNAFDSLKVFPNKSSYVLDKRNQNILKIDNQKKKANSEKKD